MCAPATSYASNTLEPMKIVSLCLLLHHFASSQKLESEGDAVPVKSSTDLKINPYSQDWWDGYFHSGPAGCQQKERTPHAYTWEGTDWSRNIDGLVLAWTRSIATGDGDIAVIIAEPESRAPASVCHAEVAADGSVAVAAESTEAREWSRFFSPMAHLCVFSSQQDWNDFLGTRGTDLPTAVSQTTVEGEHTDAPWGQDPDIRSALEGTATDQARAMARILHHLLSHVQPDIQGEVRSVLHRPNNVFLPDAGGKYVGMHVRKTEGRVYGNYKATETLDCFEKSFKYLEDLDMYAADYIPASKITNVCLVSQDDAALAEAKRLARGYFRNVKSDDVVQVSTGPGSSSPEAGGDLDQNCATHGAVGHVNALVPVLAELQLMAKADVFVGIASEAFARLVFLMRETLHLPRKTCLSLDRLKPFPGQHSRSRRSRRTR